MNLVARPCRALTGEVSIPGDKSCSHRALILGAIADGKTRIRGLLESSDVLSTIAALRALGVQIEKCGKGEWVVNGGQWSTPADAVDCGNSGTSARLLIGALSSMPGVSATVTGDSSLSSRPMARLTGPLVQMGARIDGGDRLPLSVHGGRLSGIEHRNVPPSAQVKSAVLIAGLSTNAPVRIVEPVPSRDHTEIMLAAFGCPVSVDDTPGGWVITLGNQRRLLGCDLTIGADPSSAAFPLVAAAIAPGSDVLVRGMLVNPLRTGLYETLESMGADIELSNERIQSGEIVADIRLRYAPLRACHVRADRISAMIDEIPALSVACAFADGESVIEGLSELRVKESDRLGRIVAGLTACGVVALADGDALRIFGRGRARGGARITTHGDHRIAMAFLMLGLGASNPVEVDEAAMIATSFPDFTDTMRGIGADIE